MKTLLSSIGVLIASISIAVALPAPSSGGQQTKVTNSYIDNSNQNVTNKADTGSHINSGIQAKGAQITNSAVVNTNIGVENTASKNSKVNSGIEANRATKLTLLYSTAMKKLRISRLKTVKLIPEYLPMTRKSPANR
jgi:hypothetical protein